VSDPFIGIGIGHLLDLPDAPMPTREDVLRKMREGVGRRLSGLEAFEAACEAADPGCIDRMRTMFEDSLDAGESRLHPATDEGFQAARIDQLIYGIGFVSADKAAP
jgi:hypothetical protein